MGNLKMVIEESERGVRQKVSLPTKIQSLKHVFITPKPTPDAPEHNPDTSEHNPDTKKPKKVWLRKENLHTNCSTKFLTKKNDTKWAKYGGCIPAIWEELEMVREEWDCG